MTIYVDVQDFMLGEISQTQANFSHICEFKIVELREKQIVEWWLPRVEG
jgi:hypothetical protein